jgi:hypothetical protein
VKISPPPGFDPRTVQLVASRYTNYVIPAQEDTGEYQYFKERALEGVYWINVARNMDQWQALINTVMNWGSHKGRESLDPPGDH